MQASHTDLASTVSADKYRISQLVVALSKAEAQLAAQQQLLAVVRSISHKWCQDKARLYHEAKRLSGGGEAPQMRPDQASDKELAGEAQLKAAASKASRRCAAILEGRVLA